MVGCGPIEAVGAPRAQQRKILDIRAQRKWRRELDAVVPGVTGGRAGVEI